MGPMGPMDAMAPLGPHGPMKVLWFDILRPRFLKQQFPENGVMRVSLPLTTQTGPIKTYIRT